jgi:hypothetical protein
VHVGRGPLRPSPTSRGARLSRHAAPEPVRAAGATATPIGDRRGARAWLLLTLACAALLVAAPVAIVRSPTSPDDAAREVEVYTPSDPDDDGTTGDDGGTGAVAPTAAPPPAGAVPPVPDAPALDPAAGTSPSDPAAADPGPAGTAPSAGGGSTGWTPGTGGGTAGSAPQPGGGSGWTQPRTRPITVLPSSPPASSKPPAGNPPANQQSGGSSTGGSQTGGSPTGDSTTGGSQPPPAPAPIPVPAPKPPADCLCQVLEPVTEPLEDVVTGTIGAVGGLLGG